MKKIFGNKKNIYAIIAVLVILIGIIVCALLSNKPSDADTENSVSVSETEKEAEDVKNEDVKPSDEKQEETTKEDKKAKSKEDKADKKENDVKDENVQTKAKKEDETESVEIPYLEEDETLEEVINDFNTLPEGEEKEAAREKLEKIFEFAEESAPAKNVE